MKRTFRSKVMPCFGCVNKRRYLILRGKYLFRYASESSRKSKGVPIDIENCKIEIVDKTEDDLGEILQYAFAVSSLSKSVLVSVDNCDERDRWVHSLNEAKQRAIKQRLGHVEIDDWEKQVDEIGTKCISQKQRAEQMRTTQEYTPF